MNENNEPEEPKPRVISDKPIHKHWAVWVLVLLVLLLLGGAIYLWMQLQACEDKEQQLRKDKQQLQQQVEELKQGADAAPVEAEGEEVACNDTPSASMKENIKAALDTQNTAVFETYVSNPVKYVLAASEQGGDVTPAVAAQNLDYTHSATGPWDFSLPQATLDGYDTGDYGQYFDSNTYVGKAASGMVAAFDFDCNGKIKQIFISADADLL